MMKFTDTIDQKFIIRQCLVIFLFLTQLTVILLIINIGKDIRNLQVMTVPEPSQIIHIVKPGESVFRIAQNYKVHRYQIRAWNNISSSNNIRPGQKLIIKQVDYPAVEGRASWYGPNFHGRNMANGEVYDMYDIVVAHRTLPLGRLVKVTNLENGKFIIAPVLDRGPYVTNSSGVYTREIDLSYAVARELGTISRGVVNARIEPIHEPLLQN